MTTTNGTKKATKIEPTMAHESKVLTQIFVAGEVGDTWDRAGLMQACGLDATDHEHLRLFYARLTTAKRAAEREGKVVAPIGGGKGWKLCNDSERVQGMAKAISDVHRAARRAMKRGTTLDDPAGLAEDDTTALNTYLTVLGVAKKTTHTKTVRKVEEQVRRVQHQLPDKRVMELF